jgi:putative hydrolase of the HAD superfamily
MFAGAVMVKLKNIEIVLFDMDGTLIRPTFGLPHIRGALFEAFADQLAPCTYENFFAVFSDKDADMWMMMLDGTLDGDTARLYTFRNTLRTLNKPLELAEEMLNHHQALRLDEATPFPQTYEVLEAIRKRHHTGIVTNGYRTMQRAKIDKCNLAAYVDRIYVSEEVGYHKPNPRIFWEVIQDYGSPAPEKVVYVGDEIETDVKGAQAAGLRPIFVNTDGIYDPPADITEIHQLKDLIDILA